MGNRLRLAISFITAILLTALAGYGAIAGLDVAPAPVPLPDTSEFVRRQELPKASNVEPTTPETAPTAGSSIEYARADHTHATSVQRRRWAISVAGQASEWVFSKPYPEGVIPVVTCTAENTLNAARPFVVNLSGTPTNTSVKLVVFHAAQLSGQGVLANNPLFSVAVPGTIVNCQAAKPTQ